MQTSDRNVDKHKCRQPEKQTDRNIDSQKNRQTEILTDRQTKKLANKKAIKFSVYIGNGLAKVSLQKMLNHLRWQVET